MKQNSSGKLYLAMGAVVVGCALLYSIFYLQSTSKWWFEDDPAQYSYAASMANPVAIFVDPKILGGFGTGASAVPMQLFSYWVDIKLFGISPPAAYIHSLIVFALVVLLLYTVLVRFTGNIVASACVALVWIVFALYNSRPLFSGGQALCRRPGLESAGLLWGVPVL